MHHPNYLQRKWLKPGLLLSSTEFISPAHLWVELKTDGNIKLAGHKAIGESCLLRFAFNKIIQTGVFLSILTEKVDIALH